MTQSADIVKHLKEYFEKFLERLASIVERTQRVTVVVQTQQRQGSGG